MTTEEVFQNAARAIIEMNHDAEQLKIKFGSSSKLYKDRIAQVGAMTQLHDHCAEHINTLEHIDKHKSLALRFYELEYMKTKMYLQYKHIATIYGLNSDQCLRADEALDKYMIEVMLIMDEPVPEKPKHV